MTEPNTDNGKLRLVWGAAWPLLVSVAVAAVVHLAAGRFVGTFVARIMMDVGIAVIAVVSLNFVNGFTGQFSIGHAGFMAVGGYVAAFLTYYGSLVLWGDSLRHGGALGAGEWMFAGACLIGGLAAATVGYIVGLPSLRLRGDYLAIVTLGFGEIVRVFLQQTNPVLYDAEAMKEAGWSQWAPPPVGGSLGFSDMPKYTNLFWIYLFVSITTLVAFRLKNSSAGRAMIAVREDELAAQAMGVNVTRQKVGAFVISAFFAGLAGGLSAHELGVILRPVDAGFQRSFELVIMAVLGGKGSITGVITAATLLTILPEFLRQFEQYRLIIYALLLISMMLVRPQGLFGMREVWEYFGAFRGAPRKAAS